MAVVTEHSPFIRKLLGPLADAVEPAPAPAPDPLADAAFEWLRFGVELIDSDVPSSIEALRTSVGLGSEEAMAWLGAALVHYSLELHPTDGREVALIGLGWLHLAVTMGDPFAAEKLTAAIEALPASLIEEWQSLPPYHFTTVH